MKKVIILAVIVILLTACGLKETKKMESNYEKITSSEAKKIMDEEDVIIVDVRTPEEYEEAHIKDAILIPDYELKSLTEEKLPDKNAKILVYCRSGNRSKGATKKLVDMGYTSVYDFGGIIDWSYGTVSGK